MLILSGIYKLKHQMAPFPSMVEFMRAINFESANLKNGMRLNFEYFEEEEYFGHELPMV